MPVPWGRRLRCPLTSLAVPDFVIACDFDGTITRDDTLHLVVERFGDGRTWRQLHPDLLAGRISVEAAMEREFATVRADRATALAAVREHAGLRDGFHEFIAWTRQRGYPFFVMSNGFRTIIRDFLTYVGEPDLDVYSHDCRFDTDPPSIVWAERGGVCTLCDRPCKRHDLGNVRGDARVVYIGDGLSDRCVAQAADIVYARDHLAEYLTGLAVPFRPFDTFHDIQADLSRTADAA